MNGHGYFDIMIHIITIRVNHNILHSPSCYASEHLYHTCILFWQVSLVIHPSPA